LQTFVWFFRNVKVGELPQHEFEIDMELEGKAEEVCVFFWIPYWPIM